MKKTLSLLCALVALVACTKENTETKEIVQQDNQEIKVNLTISCSEITDITKATVKSGWANGDVVFVFFKGVSTDVEESLVKYLELKYDSKSTSWIAKSKRGLCAEDLANASAKELTAIYMPYGSNMIPYLHTSNKQIYFTPTYYGHFYADANKGYTFTDATLGASIELVAQIPENISTGKLVHFDVSDGFDPSHTYYLTQDNVWQMSFEIGADGVNLITSRGREGGALPGYYDKANGIISFSGVLTPAAVGGDPKNYSFLIHDKTDNTAYYYNAGKKTISKNMYIGLGNIGDDSKWQHITEKYFSVGATKVATFAPGNLQATYDAEKEKWTWNFAANQYTVLNDSGNNLSFNADGTYDGTSGTLDLFGWVGASSDLTGVAQYGIYASTNDTNTGHYGTSDSEQLKCDWGLNTIGSYAPGTWRTPTNDNMTYIFSRRSNSGHLAKINNVPNATYAKGKVNGIKGIILFADNYVHPDGVTLPNNINEPKCNFEGNDYSVSDWASMEANGAVFLPITKYRLGDQLKGGAALYWYNTSATTEKDELRAYRLNTTSNALNYSDPVIRARGLAVRLIHDLN